MVFGRVQQSVQSKYCLGLLIAVRLSRHLASVLLLCSLPAHAQLSQPDGGKLERGSLPLRWLSQGPKCMEIPAWQVHEYNPDFFLLRQSPCTDYEKPFLFLIFGRDKALLLDTGSRDGDLGPTLRATVRSWLERNGRATIPLIVAHTHEHEDHTWGDRSVLAINDPAMPVTLVPAEVEATKKFFGIAHWPSDTGHIDLGGRVLDLVPLPGHSAASVAFYDRKTGILLAGDSLYPGRIYIRDFPAFQASIERLLQFTEGKPIAHILGNHIEQTTTPFVDYPVGTLYQPDEHPLALGRGALLELDAALVSMHGQPRRLALRDFSIWPSGPAFTGAKEEADYTRHLDQEKRERWDHTKTR